MESTNCTDAFGGIGGSPFGLGREGDLHSKDLVEALALSPSQDSGCICSCIMWDSVFGRGFVVVPTPCSQCSLWALEQCSRLGKMHRVCDMQLDMPLGWTQWV